MHRFLDCTDSAILALAYSSSDYIYICFQTRQKIGVSTYRFECVLCAAYILKIGISSPLLQFD